MFSNRNVFFWGKKKKVNDKTDSLKTCGGPACVEISINAVIQGKLLAIPFYLPNRNPEALLSLARDHIGFVAL